MLSRKTRIVATIGPASDSEEVLRELILSGMNVARLNFSHGDHQSHGQVFERLRTISQKVGRTVSILQDLCGPKIRLGEVQPDTFLEPGQAIRFCSEEVVGDATRATISYSGLHREVKPGDRILIDDGNLEVVVTAVEGDDVVGQVVHGGEFKSRKGVNLPGVELSVPALTPKDEEDLRFGLSIGVDVVALSFVRKASDLDRVREIMNEVGVRRPLIVKIEKGEALRELDDIVRRADGIMVARGDLGVEVPLEEVPLIQKRLIALCIEHGRPVITATQMLDSMIDSPRPTRAEVNDVANAILDGTDAVMLSGETAAGRFPVRAVQVMDRIARRAEQNLDYLSIHQKMAPPGQPVEAVALAACEIAEEVGAGAILACSASGRTVRAISRYRPRAPILGVATEPHVAREFFLSWGVTPLLVGEYENTDQLIQGALAAARSQAELPEGSLVVIAAGVPMGSPTNLLMVQTT